ncbi:MAG TPA: CBS domain-containing protein, partial [Candidatus Acidoferrales bacterium]|nr:CBS domain-containing protein [Candidatus Acidoferrales bacterium]
AAETLAELDSRLQTQLVEKLDPEKAADIIEEMRPDEAADLLGSLPAETSKEIIEELHGQDAHEVRQLLRFERDTAGGMMNTELVTVAEDATRGEVVDYVRFHEIPLDQLDDVILTNRDQALTGTVRLAKLLVADTEQKMSELVTDKPISIQADAAEREVFELFDKYNLRSLTVVDTANRPIGAITVDDVVSHMRASL